MTAPPITILIIDDAAIARIVACKVFADDKRFEVIATANDGIEGLKALETHHPQVILLDIEMPRMDGLQFLRIARAQCAAKIVVLSGKLLPGSTVARQAHELGADAIFQKPSGTVSLDLDEASGDDLRDAIFSLVNPDSK